jgi:nitrogen fixation protein FixH
MISQDSKKGMRNPWFLGMIGLIAVVLGVNGTFIWLAMQNHPALVDREYSTKDRKSDTAALNDLEAHRALAWQTTIKQPKSIVMNSLMAYEIGVADRAGLPVSGTMEVEAYRASDAGRDFTTAFRETSPGNYQGYIDFPLKGYWELRIRIKRGEEMFEVNTERFMVATAS